MTTAKGVPFYLSSTGTATAFLTPLTFNLPKSFSSVIILLPCLEASDSIVIFPLVYAFPAKPRLLFILIELAVN